ERGADGVSIRTRWIGPEVGVASGRRVGAGARVVAGQGRRVLAGRGGVAAADEGVVARRVRPLAGRAVAGTAAARQEQETAEEQRAVHAEYPFFTAWVGRRPRKWCRFPRPCRCRWSCRRPRRGPRRRRSSAPR